MVAASVVNRLAEAQLHPRMVPAEFIRAGSASSVSPFDGLYAGGIRCLGNQLLEQASSRIKVLAASAELLRPAGYSDAFHQSCAAIYRKFYGLRIG